MKSRKFPPTNFSVLRAYAHARPPSAEKRLLSVVQTVVRSSRRFCGGTINKLKKSFAVRYSTLNRHSKRIRRVTIFALTWLFFSDIGDRYVLKDVVPSHTKLDRETLHGQTSTRSTRSEFIIIMYNYTRARLTALMPRIIRRATNFRTTKINSDGHLQHFTKICTHENNPLYGISEKQLIILCALE